jgi:hypothetical protein
MEDASFVYKEQAVYMVGCLGTRSNKINQALHYNSILPPKSPHTSPIDLIYLYTTKTATNQQNLNTAKQSTCHPQFNQTPTVASATSSPTSAAKP